MLEKLLASCPHLLACYLCLIRKYLPDHFFDWLRSSGLPQEHH